jgi:hypothetical protein
MVAVQIDARSGKRACQHRAALDREPRGEKISSLIAHAANILLLSTDSGQHFKETSDER